MPLVAISQWLRRKTAWKQFWTNTSIFLVLQAAIVVLKLRLSALAPELDPPLDYRYKGYSPEEAMAVMGAYSGPARTTAAVMEITDCIYSFAYAALFSGLLGVSIAATRAPEALHLLNLVPLATAVVDVFENCLMLVLLAGPRADAARAVVAASALKWQLLMATGSIVFGTGMYCVVKGGRGGGGKGRRGGEESAAKARKATRRA
ncbi:hypothetical protein Rsub_01264 [Raphidocelis subcapitata]|uniref:Uncharacterized protein n=1 Tax=Raphidocelis subcapitata TaxID=307507 RepID=A0A2V0NN02_9CHLO|nr:hypothetical protein Rsub_01264 [Raphidocelis subcapitata]|eukprot:GBF88549.1 hypothetical protein Rsub_01264 [Raphidocelis subcapitata]